MVRIAADVEGCAIVAAGEGTERGEAISRFYIGWDKDGVRIAVKIAVEGRVCWKIG